MTQYANIIVDIAHEKVDRPFQYRVPPDMEGVLKVGMEVSIPFGRGDKLRSGYVMELTDRCGWDPEKLKEIRSVRPRRESVEQQFLELAHWMHRRYGATMIRCLKTVLPVKQQVEQEQQRMVRLCLSGEALLEQTVLYEKKHAAARLRVLQAFSGRCEVPYQAVTKEINVPAGVIKAMEEAGILKVQAAECYRVPSVIRAALTRVKEAPEAPPELTGDQKHIIGGILEQYREGVRRTVLIHGVTGSGKTEIYIRLAEAMAEKKKASIILIPEIALTYQTVLRFVRRFGDRVSVLHSRMSPGERYDQFRRAKNGLLDVIIGPRSALFAPFSDLGLIVIDEEHEPAYKSDTMPRYHARETAEARAAMCGAMVVLGSATPSVEAYSRAMDGTYTLYTIRRRAGEGRLPQVSVVDLRRELAEGNRTMFSRSLYEAMRQRLEKKEQIMLFLNRRGYAGFVSCRSCGSPVKCPHCDVSMTFHGDPEGEGRLICHYCGCTIPMVKTCPTCGSPYIGTFKAGTQQIQRGVERLFPGARVLRMDMDTTRGRDSYQNILQQFARGEADVLVGTQMIVKGHDFPNVTLMGVLAADISLHMSDYRAAERTYQLLAQAAGRAGRGERGGQVIFQTYQPDHYAVRCAAAHDYEQFYKEEISYRRLGGYPPASHLLAVLVGAAGEEEAAALAGALKEAALEAGLPGSAPGSEIPSGGSEAAPLAPFSEGLSAMGPAPAPVARVKDMYQQVLYLRHGSTSVLAEAREAMEAAFARWEQGKNVTVQYDLDPV